MLFSTSSNKYPTTTSWEAASLTLGLGPDIEVTGKSVPKQSIFKKYFISDGNHLLKMPDSKNSVFPHSYCMTHWYVSATFFFLKEKEWDPFFPPLRKTAYF